MRARSCACEGVSECAGVCVYSYSRWMCVKYLLVVSDCHVDICIIL